MVESEKTSLFQKQTNPTKGEQVGWGEAITSSQWQGLVGAMIAGSAKNPTMPAQQALFSKSYGLTKGPIFQKRRP